MEPKFLLTTPEEMHDRGWDQLDVILISGDSYIDSPYIGVAVIGMVLLYPMMFISGAGMPLEIMPETIRTIARFMPLYYVVNLTKGLWFGESWSAYLLDVVVLICIVTIGFGIASRFFKWK